MPGHLFEGNPVDEGTTRRGTDTPVHRPPKLQVPHTTRHTALDRSEKRQELTRDNLARCAITSVITLGDAADWLPEEGAGCFDLVLADVPCTNSGVFRRRPDALWRWSEAALNAMTALQSEILFHAGDLCAPGGTLLYSTCSLEEEENA